MPGVYVVHDDGSSQPMERVRCRDEDRELQRILEKNPDLLPGDQISPDDPRRWLLIRREMPVADPGRGVDRWNLDFLFADQDAVPTFVECKRFADTRSRREIIGQMLEYAANGHRYWDRTKLRDRANESVQGRGQTLDDALLALQGPAGKSTDQFFELLEQNLQEGNIRIIFFLEESPTELRSVVEFLSKQMERSEILLVEARQYRLAGMTVVVPTLYGYTEQLRKVFQPLAGGALLARKRWDEASYFSDAAERLHEQAAPLRTLYDKSKRPGFQLTWGTGQDCGSFNVKAPALCPRSLITVLSNGRLWLNFVWLPEPCRDRLKALASERIGLSVPEDYQQRQPGYPVSQWGPKAEVLMDGLSDIVAELQDSPDLGSAVEN